MKPLLAVLVSFFSVVDVASKVFAPFLGARRVRPSWAERLAALHVAGLAPIAGGASLAEATHTAEFLLSEDDGGSSRTNVIVLSGQTLAAGAVIGEVGIGVGKAAIPAVAGTGNGLMSAVYPGPNVQLGNYIVKCKTVVTNGGVFSVTAPDGTALPDATVGTAYVSEHVNFLISDGATDFALNDQFTLAVATGNPTVVGTGNGTIGTISLGPDAMPGRYQLKCTAAATNAGTFAVIAPNGERLADATVAVAFTSRQLNFTIADGSTDYIVGDFYEVVAYNELVAKVAAWDPKPSTYDGRQTVAGVLYAAVDASGGDLAGVIISRVAEVFGSRLAWKSGVTATQQGDGKQGLEALGIRVR